MFQETRKLYKVALLLAVIAIAALTLLKGLYKQDWLDYPICIGIGALVVCAVRLVRSPKKPFPDIKVLQDLNDDEILCEALGNLGGISAKSAAAKLPCNNLSLEILCNAPAEKVQSAAETYFSQHGCHIKTESMGDGFKIKGLIGAGKMNLNPAVVTISVVGTVPPTKTTILGSAKEGLIKQRAGEQAANRVKEFLSSQFPQSTSE